MNAASPTSSDRATIQGRVTDAQGNPVPGASVLITGASPSHPDIAARTSANGTYRYSNLTPGLYTLLVNAEGYPTQTQHIQATAGTEASLDFHLERSL
jgi:Carboxypeptidase regulatory-like domain